MSSSQTATGAAVHAPVPGTFAEAYRTHAPRVARCLTGDTLDQVRLIMPIPQALRFQDHALHDVFFPKRETGCAPALTTLTANSLSSISCSSHSRRTSRRKARPKRSRARSSCTLTVD